MRRMSPQALYRSGSHRKRPFHREAFPRPGSGKLDPFIIRIREIKTQAHGFFNLDAFCSFVDKTRRPGDRPVLFKQRVQQFQPDPGHRILQPDYQGLCLPVRFRVSCRQSFQGRFTRTELTGIIDKLRQPAAVLLQNRDSALPEITASVNRIFQFHKFQGKKVLLRLIGGMRTQGRFQQIAEILPVMDPLSKIDLCKLSSRQNRHYITDLVILKMKGFCFLMNQYIHIILHNLLKAAALLAKLFQLIALFHLLLRIIIQKLF